LASLARLPSRAASAIKYAASAPSTSFCAAAPCASSSCERRNAFSAACKFASADRASASACPKSGESIAASAAPAASVWPRLAAIPATRPATGVNTRTVASSFQHSRPVKCVTATCRGRAASIVNDASCGASAGKTMLAPSTFGGGGSGAAVSSF